MESKINMPKKKITTKNKQTIIIIMRISIELIKEKIFILNKKGK